MSSKIENLKNSSLDHLYRNFNHFAKTHKKWARSMALPLAIFNSMADLATLPIIVIEQLALAAFNLIKVAFSAKSASLSKCVAHLNTAGETLLCTPQKILFSSIAIIIKTIFIMFKPEVAKRDGVLNFAFLVDPAFILCEPST